MYARPMTVCAMFNVCKPYQNAIDLEVNLEFDKAKGDIQNIELVTFQVDSWTRYPMRTSLSVGQH